MDRKVQLVFLISLVSWSVSSAGEELKWWQKGVIYQVYPRSFKDSNNDGVGDLPGITSQLGYLKELGVAGFWLSPIYPSPMVDFGYDIANFTDVDPLFGTLDDFDQLVKTAKSLGLRVIMDFVPNHSSDKHEWFIKSVKKEAGYEDYYVWRDPKGFNQDGSPIPPNNWLSVFYGSAWEWNEERQQFYLHQFTTGQPDLNYRNPAVVQEMKDAISFWLKRGVDGYRIDAISTVFEDIRELDEPRATDGVTDDPNNRDYLQHPYTSDQPETYDMVRQWRELIDAASAEDGVDRCIMVEMYGSIPLTMDYFGTEEAPGAHFPFNFQLIPSVADTRARDYKRIIDEWVDNVPTWGWNNWVLGNHDRNRIGSRVGADMRDVMHFMVHALPGTAITYYGEELGMLDNLNITYDDGVDPNGCNYPAEEWYQRSRDFERTPMQWNDSVNAGFNEGAPTWLPVNSNYKEINLAAERADPTSHYNTYKSLVSKIRTTNAWLNGKLTTQITDNNTLAILRHVDAHDYFVALLNIGKSREVVNVASLFPIDNKLNLTVLVASKSSNLNEGDIVLAGAIDLQGKSAIIVAPIQK